jgi:hypothetical protein
MNWKQKFIIRYCELNKDYEQRALCFINKLKKFPLTDVYWHGFETYDFGNGVLISLYNANKDVKSGNAYTFTPDDERTPHIFYVERIFSNERNKGYAASALNELIAIADECGVVLRLEPSPTNEKSSDKVKGRTLPQLKKWYGGKGFSPISDKFWERPNKRLASIYDDDDMFVDDRYSRERFYELLEQQKEKIVSDFLDGVKKQNWELIPKNDLIVIMNEFSKYGAVRNSDLLNKVYSIMCENVRKILANGWIINYSDVINDDNVDDFIEYIRESEGRLGRYSDAQHLFEKAYSQLANARDDRAKILAIDFALNIVHGMGGVAHWFVEGGVNTLNYLHDIEGYRIN